MTLMVPENSLYVLLTQTINVTGTEIGNRRNGLLLHSMNNSTTVGVGPRLMTYQTIFRTRPGPHEGTLYSNLNVSILRPSTSPTPIVNVKTSA